MQDEQTTDKVRHRKMKLSVEAVKPGKYNKIKKRRGETDSEGEENSCNINFSSLQVS